MILLKIKAQSSYLSPLNEGGERGALNFHLKSYHLSFFYYLNFTQLWLGCTLLFCEMTSDQLTRQQFCVIYKGDILFEHQLPDFAYLERLAGLFPLDKRLLSSGCMSKSFLLGKLTGIVIFHQSSPSLIQG